MVQLRRLQRELKDYAPPALTSHYLRNSHHNTDEERPWWTRAAEDEVDAESEQKALVRVKTHAEDLAGLTTPKVIIFPLCEYSTFI